MGEVTVVKVVTLDTLHLKYENVEFLLSTEENISNSEQAVHTLMADIKNSCLFEVTVKADLDSKICVMCAYDKCTT